MIADHESRFVAQIEDETDPLLVETGLQKLRGLDDGRPDVQPLRKTVRGSRHRTEPIEEPFDARDLPCHDTTEILEEAWLVVAPGNELREGLDGDEGVLDFVRDARREHLEVGQPLGAPTLVFELLERREIAEHGHRADHCPRRVVERRGGADHGMAGGSTRQRDLRLGAGLPATHRSEERARERIGKARGRHPLDLFGGQSGEPLGRRVDHGDPADGVHRDHPALDRRDDVPHILVGENDLGIELRVLDGDPERHTKPERCLQSHPARGTPDGASEGDRGPRVEGRLQQRGK